LLAEFLGEILNERDYKEDLSMDGTKMLERDLKEIDDRYRAGLM
jgi:hypothetical protein